MILNLGVIGLSEGNGHPYSWSAIFNGYDSVEMDELIRILTEVFQGDADAVYLRDFMELEILDLDKIAVVGANGSKSTRQKLMDYVLGR